MYIFLKFTNDNFNKEHIGDDFMLEKMAWNTFKNTGNIDTYLELKQIENIEENIEKNTSDILIDKTIKKENNIIL